MSLFDLIFPDWLFPSLADRAVASTDFEDADLLYASSVKTDMRENVVAELDSRGLDVGEIKPGDLSYEGDEIYIGDTPAEELEDTKIFYRQKMFLSGLDNGEEAEVKRTLQRLEQDYGIEFVNDPLGADIADDKEWTKDILEDEYEDLEGIDVPETYESLDEIKALEDDKTITRKPKDQWKGKGIEFLESGEVDEFDDDAIYEEFVDHYSGEAKDLRAFVVGGEPVAVKERVKDSEEPEPKNIANGSHYEDPGSVSLNGVLASSIASDALEMPVAAVDYAEMEDGSVNVYEVNATAGTAINDEIDGDLHDMIADYLEEEALEAQGLADDLQKTSYLEPESGVEKASAV